MKLAMNSIFQPSGTVFLHDLEGETILVSASNGIDHNDNEVLKINGTGRAVWDMLDGKRDVNAVLREMSNRFDAPEPAIRNDIETFLQELLQRRMIVEVGPSYP